MIPAVESRLATVAELCARHRVRRLSLFGSAATGRAEAGSDIDLLVDFRPMSPREHADSYFGLLADLERLFGMPVDLVESAPIRNPYFRRTVDATQVVLFEAA